MIVWAAVLTVRCIGLDYTGKGTYIKLYRKLIAMQAKCIIFSRRMGSLCMRVRVCVCVVGQEGDDIGTIFWRDSGE